MARRPRDPQREQTWRRHLQRQKDSGYPVRRYCHIHGLSEATFYFWRKTLARRDADNAALNAPQAPAFLPVSLSTTPPPHPPSAIDIRLTGGQRLRVRPGCDPQLLAHVLDALEGRSC